jgi:hypothetical protein
MNEFSHRISCGHIPPMLQRSVHLLFFRAIPPLFAQKEGD